jgi:hypothetical protein
MTSIPSVPWMVRTTVPPILPAAPTTIALIISMLLFDKMTYIQSNNEALLKQGLNPKSEARNPKQYPNPNI